MRRRCTTTSALLAAAALMAAPAAPAHGVKETKLSCTIEATLVKPPPPAAVQLGFASCPRPFGQGLHYSTFTVAPTSPGHGSITGTFRNFYRRGTASGTVAMTFAATSPTDITYTGTVTYTGGSGDFKHVAGGGTIECTTTDGGAHKSCKVNTTLTGI